VLTGQRYAQGERAWGECGRCGGRFLLRYLIFDGHMPNMRVCVSCWEPKHPQENPVRVVDAVALWRPSPEQLPSPRVPVLTGAALSSGNELQWTPSEGSVAQVRSYHLYRRLTEAGDGTPGEWEEIFTLPVVRDIFGAVLTTPEALTYTDTDAALNVSYDYQVAAHPVQGPDALSNVVTLLRPDEAVAPVLSAELEEDDGNTYIRLNWTEATGGTVEAYDIYRAVNGGEFELWAEGIDPWNLTSLDDTVEPGNTYSYYVATRGSRTWPNSNIVEMQIEAGDLVPTGILYYQHFVSQVDTTQVARLNITIPEDAKWSDLLVVAAVRTIPVSDPGAHGIAAIAFDSDTLGYMDRIELPDAEWNDGNGVRTFKGQMAIGVFPYEGLLEWYAGQTVQISVTGLQDRTEEYSGFIVVIFRNVDFKDFQSHSDVADFNSFAVETFEAGSVPSSGLELAADPAEHSQTRAIFTAAVRTLFTGAEGQAFEHITPEGVTIFDEIVVGPYALRVGYRETTRHPPATEMAEWRFSGFDAVGGATTGVAAVTHLSLTPLPPGERVAPEIQDIDEIVEAESAALRITWSAANFLNQDVLHYEILRIDSQMYEGAPSFSQPPSVDQLWFVTIVSADTLEYLDQEANDFFNRQYAYAIRAVGAETFAFLESDVALSSSPT